MLNEVERVRKALSADNEAALQVENILELDEDHEYDLTIEQLDSLISPVSEKLESLFKDALDILY